MRNSTLSFSSRLGLALRTFLAILSDQQFAARVLAWHAGAPHAQSPATAEAKAADLLHAAAPDAALQLLGLLQREARFIDFVEEDVAAYSDTDIGSAARVVHEGCRRVLRENFTISPVRSEAEGTRITLAPGFDAAAIRITGNVVGQPPFTGAVAHRGWRVDATRLPRLASGHDTRIVAPAEVEL